jgi:hypothetical protein
MNGYYLASFILMLLVAFAIGLLCTNYWIAGIAGFIIGVIWPTKVIADTLERTFSR